MSSAEHHGRNEWVSWPVAASLTTRSPRLPPEASVPVAFGFARSGLRSGGVPVLCLRCSEGDLVSDGGEGVRPRGGEGDGEGVGL
jgi:hypothetical protein